MPPPKLPPRSMPQTPIPLSPKLAGLQAMLDELAKTERTERLVDYLYDLRREMFWVMDELAELDFDALELLAGIDDEEDDDDDDCPEEEW
jgi:hypothetical protein